jgi:hypothetical protein
MSYYHFYRTAKEETPKFVDAGWHLLKIDQFKDEEMERYNAYTGNFIHRLFVPEEIAGQIKIRRGNSHTDWKKSSDNPLENLADLKDDFATVWEIQFDDSIKPEDYYLRQKYPQELNWVGTEVGDPVKVPKPEILQMGVKVEALLSPPDPEISRL